MSPVELEGLSRLFETAVQSGNWALVGLLVFVAALGWALRKRKPPK